MLCPSLFISLASSFWTAALHVSKTQWQQPSPLSLYVCLSVTSLDKVSCHWAAVSVWFLLRTPGSPQKAKTKLKPCGLNTVRCAVYCNQPCNPRVFISRVRQAVENTAAPSPPAVCCLSSAQPPTPLRPQSHVAQENPVTCGYCISLLSSLRLWLRGGSSFRRWEHIVQRKALRSHVTHSARQITCNFPYLFSSAACHIPGINSSAVFMQPNAILASVTNVGGKRIVCTKWL